MKRLKLIFVVVIFSFCFVNAKSQINSSVDKIRTIRLLETTFQQIETMFGEQTVRDPNRIWKYKTADGEINISFSDGRCTVVMGQTHKDFGWKVPAGRVQEITYYPRHPKTPKKYGIDLTGLPFDRVSDSADAKQYFNEVSGEYYGVNSKGQIEEIVFVPKQTQSNLKCK